MKVKLIDPHPGVGGAMVPLPKKITQLAASMAGKVMEVDKAVQKIQAEASKLSTEFSCRDVANSSMIMLQYGDFSKGGPVHSWRVLRYEEA